MNISHDEFYQTLTEHNRQAMNSWSYPMFDDLRIDEYEDEEWEEEEDDEEGESIELTPEQRERMSKDIQKILKEGKERSDRIWENILSNSKERSYQKWIRTNIKNLQA